MNNSSPVLTESNLATPPVAMIDSTALAAMNRYVAWSGLEMVLAQAGSGQILAQSLDELPNRLPESIRLQLPQVQGMELFEDEFQNQTFFGIALPSKRRGQFVAVGAVNAEPPSCRVAETIEPKPEGCDERPSQDWGRGVNFCSPKILRAMLSTLVEREELEERCAHAAEDVQLFSEQLEYSFEEISLLHDLTSRLQISRGGSELAELCLNRMHLQTAAGGSVIWLQEKNRTPQLLCKGDVPFDELELSQLIAEFHDHNWSRPLVNNSIGKTKIGENYPQLKSLIIVPIAEGPHRFGWILSCNADERQEFGTIQASLMNTVAVILGTHLCNIDLYRQHDELLLSFVRSLVSTLDAKDQYTRGHSQRVALIGRRLGEELQLETDDLKDIYLSGLLHDLGKIGIDEKTLHKPGQLTEEEFSEIKRHPLIGFSILKGLKNLQAILPGVRNHHESYDGSGYPDGLVGEEIPMMARILAVADSYDAMSSDRPYRKGLPLEKIEKIFQHGSGQQWDTHVIAAYFTARDDIQQICKNFSLQDSLLLETPGIIADVLFQP